MVSEVARLIEFITGVIHRQAFNTSCDIKTDSKKIGIYISSEADEMEDEMRAKTKESIFAFLH